MISIIVPTLNEETCIAGTLNTLLELTGDKEILVVDGGSQDRTLEIVRALGCRVVPSDRGRGCQLQAAGAEASGEVLWFVHADTRPGPGALEAIEAALRDGRVVGGNFALIFDGDHYAARQMTWIYPLLRLLGLSYGDAGIFIRKTVYDAIGGCHPYPLFEDLDLVQRMKRHGKFLHLPSRIVTSARRFSGPGYVRAWTIWITLQLLYWLGVSPYRLAKWYRHVR